MKTIGKWLLVIVFLLSIRLVNIETSAHFMSDEARDLMHIHQIWVEKKITLVGPISDDRSHLFSSLTYYMLLPFASLFNFEPIGTVAGAVFWGVITALVLIWMIFRMNKRLLTAGIVLIGVWYPLVETSRWPWNPNFIPFWLALGTILLNNKDKLSKFFSGLALGLSLHHHFLTILPTVLLWIKKRSFIAAAGIVCAFIPFVIFDLRHPPGLFLSRTILYHNNQEKITVKSAASKSIAAFKLANEYFFRWSYILPFSAIITTILLVWDIKKKNKANYFALLWMSPILLMVKYSPQTHYILPGLPFFLAWLFHSRDRAGSYMSYGLIGLAILGSVVSLPKLLNSDDYTGNIKVLTSVTHILAEQITAQKAINANIAVLSSPDIYTNGNKYRELLLNYDVRLKSYDEYTTSDNLFVITTADEKKLRSDPAAELAFFKNGPVAGVWPVAGTDWKVIQFNRY